MENREELFKNAETLIEQSLEDIDIAQEWLHKNLNSIPPQISVAVTQYIDARKERIRTTENMLMEYASQLEAGGNND